MFGVFCSRASESSILRRTALSLLKNNHSTKVGIKNKRLTAAQDLAWALINNPAFLFNH